MSTDFTLWIPLLTQGMIKTILIWLGSALISLTMGTIIGVLRCRRVRAPYLGEALDGLTFVFRGVPFYVQLLVAYFVLPDLLGINLSPIMAGVISLGMCSGAYVSQMVRGGINSLPEEQWDSAMVLGLSQNQTLRYLILPQGLRTIVPMLSGELDQLLKSTSLLSAIGVLELTRAGMNIVARDMQVVLAYLSIAVIYLLLSSLLNVCSSVLERKLTYDRS